MPLLIRLAAAFAGFWAACATLAILTLIATALFGDGPFEFNGEPLSRAEFFRRLPLAVLGIGVFIAYFGAIAVGAWRERAWVRPAVLALWLAVSALLVGQRVVGAMDLVTAIAWSAVYLTFVSWYFYAKPNVTSYYRALELRERDVRVGAPIDHRAAV
jgi:hypothetical protein